MERACAGWITDMYDRTPKILYIEDDRGLANLFKRRLQREGYCVQLAGAAEEGLKILDRDCFDVLCVDHQLPGRSGLDIIRELAAQDRLPPSIMISGSGDEYVANRALELGALMYIPKDNDLAYLNKLPLAIESVMESKPGPDVQASESSSKPWPGFPLRPIK